MIDTAHAREGRYVTEWLSAVRLTLIDYATMAFVLMSVTFGPALVWMLVWIAAR